MNLPKIVFFDIDETIYRKSTDTLRPSVMEAMKALKQRGILTAIATGRAPVAIPEKVKDLVREVGIDMLVTINGQFIEFRGDVLQSYPLPKDKMLEMSHFFDEHGIAYAFVNDQEIAISAPTDWAEESLAKIMPKHITDKQYFLHHPVYQMLVFYSVEQNHIVAAKVEEVGLKVVRWDEHAVDMLQSDGSKSRGIRDAIAQLGIDMKDVMAFGDGLNDVEMLKAVGFGVAMGNAAEETKAAARYVCPSVDEDGVYRGLQELGIIGL